MLPIPMEMFRHQWVEQTRTRKNISTMAISKFLPLLTTPVITSSSSFLSQCTKFRRYQQGQSLGITGTTANLSGYPQKTPAKVSGVSAISSGRLSGSDTLRLAWVPLIRRVGSGSDAMYRMPHQLNHNFQLKFSVRILPIGSNSRTFDGAVTSLQQSESWVLQHYRFSPLRCWCLKW
jgi:hypothetical protein